MTTTTSYDIAAISRKGAMCQPAQMTVTYGPAHAPAERHVLDENELPESLRLEVETLEARAKADPEGTWKSAQANTRRLTGQDTL